MTEKELKEFELGLKVCEVAENLHEGLMRYFEHHILPGRFLTACLENNLKNAIGFASTKTWDYIFSVMNFLYTFVPDDTWGSKEIVQAWLAPCPRRLDCM